MEYLMGDIDVYFIKDAIYFCIDDKSILDNGKNIPIYQSKSVDIIEYIKQENEDVYYCGKFPLVCVDLLRKKYIKSSTAKNILQKYRNFKYQGFTLGDFIESCKYEKISKAMLLDMFSDISYGFDRKIAMLKVAIKLNTDDLSTITEKMIDEELLNIQLQRNQKQSELYSKIAQEF